MSARPSVPDPAGRAAAPAALSAFLRGVERRGAVLAELQAGDPRAGDAALAAAMRQFRAGAGALAMSEWPGRFWAALLAQPSLRNRTPVALPLDATDRLAEVGSGPRAALLLRLAAGLSEADAAQSLGVARSSYRLALQRALPRQADGRADPQAWQRLRETIHRRIKTLPPERLARLHDARAAALANSDGLKLSDRDLRDPDADDPRAALHRRGSRSRGPWLLPVLWGLLGLCALAFAASFWWPLAPHYQGVVAGRVRVDALPATGRPAARYGEVAGLLSHRDFELLADPRGAARARALAFHSWLLARGEVPEPATSPSKADTAAGRRAAPDSGDASAAH